MTQSSGSFPNDCLTNIYVLHGFEEFGYFVCEVARPPGNAATQHLPSKQGNLARLRKAENELRDASLLATLDVEKLELFTFFRKQDLLRDQKALFTKLAPVLRNNHLVRSYNSGGTAAQLLKPEQNRIYGLFTRAILASIAPAYFGVKGTIPLGPRACLRRVMASTTTPSSAVNEEHIESWVLDAIGIQVLATGTVVVASATFSDTKIFAVSPLLSPGSSRLPTLTNRATLCLAPIGQLARYVDPDPESSMSPDDKRESLERSMRPHKLEGAGGLRQQAWERKSRTFIQRLGVTSDVEWDKVIWLEVEIPVFSEDEKAETSFPARRLSWRKISWPASLIFYTTGSISVASEHEEGAELEFEDPWEFMEKWIDSTQDRAGALRSAQGDQLDQDLSETDLQMDYLPQIQNPGPVDFPPSQLMYPTPPDGPLTQATPGISSFDVMDMAQAPLPRQMPEVEQMVPDEVIGIIQVQAVGVGSGFYDEDLFEEMPGDNFSPAEVTEEPNWDFFDQPDFDMPDVDAGEKHRESEETQRPADASPGAKQMLKQEAGTTRIEWNDTAGQENPQEPSVFPDAPVDEDSGTQTIEDSPLGTRLNESNPDHGSLENDIIALEEKDGFASPNQGMVEHGSVVTSQKRRRSVYDSIHAKTRNGALHKNSYGTEGKFWFDWSGSATAKEATAGGSVKSTAGSGRVYERQLAASNPVSESSCSSSSNDDDAAESPAIPLDTKRKWTEYTPPSPEAEKPFVEPLDVESIERECSELLEVLQMQSYELPFRTPQVWNDHRFSRDRRVADIGTVAQILVDQFTQTSFRDWLEGGITKLLTDYLHASSNLHVIESPWQRLDLGSLSQQGSDVRVAREPSIEKLEENRVRLERSDQGLTVLPAIIAHWDTLSLQPHGKSKDITAFCISPSGRSVAESCEDLLTRLSETYHRCNLGIHKTGQIAGTTNNGLVEWTTGLALTPGLLQACERLGHALARDFTIHGTIMIYMIAIVADLASYTTCCDAFYTLFDTYVKDCRKHKPNDVQLQIVPLKFIASADTIVVRSQAEYLRLAVEVYNRCPPATGADRLAYCGSAVVLADDLSRSVEFDLATEAISPLSKTGKCLHVAYSQSADKRWITAAWTDGQGYQALTMSYCLRLRGSKLSRSRTEILQEMWEVSQDLMTKHPSRWRLVVAKDGPYEADEINDWRYQVNSTANEKSTALCTLVLISVDLNSDLKLTIPPSTATPQIKVATQGQTPGPQAGQTPMQSQSQLSRDYGTPLSASALTPIATSAFNFNSTTSPSGDQFAASTPLPTPGGTGLVATAGNAATPPDQHSFDPTTDIDLTVSDPAEESWSVTLGFGLNQSTKITEARPAMGSGLLLKRKGPRDEDGVSVLGVNLVDVVGGRSREEKEGWKEKLVREIIGQYRGLITLAGTRWGTAVDRGGGTGIELLPWHVGTAVKGARALSWVF